MYSNENEIGHFRVMKITLVLGGQILDKTSISNLKRKKKNRKNNFAKKSYDLDDVFLYTYIES